MPNLSPRVVFVIRETEYELLLARHATPQQARFFLESRGQNLSDLEAAHSGFQHVLKFARSRVPDDWRQALVQRRDLDRFLFAGEDLIVAIGQDGLVANVAKYLNGQPVIGINSAPDRFDGVLMHVPIASLDKALHAAVGGKSSIEFRTMAEARLDSGERLLALNELFIGHRSHQSALYTIEFGDFKERQSSSGLIVATGTGATGWARSIIEATGNDIHLAPTARTLGFLVREPFPSLSTGTSIRAGVLEKNKTLLVKSQMNDGGVIFADGIEQDFLSFDWGRELTVTPSERQLCLVKI